ncbi:MAG: MBL fold metallo-hydrolase, partial [Deltaproteobacteria bacterium]|nr:MBL fold metallo-hydrolase [Deltaproteobacteria bacterium]
VGYGDAILLKLPQQGAMLIDAGTQKCGERVASYIKDRGVKKLDVVVITHCHPDHIGGIPKILESVKVDEIWVNQDISRNLSYSPVYKAIQRWKIPWRVIRRGENLDDVGGVEIECLHPGRISHDPNDNSVVLKICYKKTVFLFPGDITPKAEKVLLDIYKGRLKGDVVKIPHHGHKSTYPFIEAIGPEIAVLTIGPNPYGAPHPQTLRAYSEKGCCVLRTNELENIVIRTDGQRIWLETGGR